MDIIFGLEFDPSGLLSDLILSLLLFALCLCLLTASSLYMALLKALWLT